MLKKDLINGIFALTDKEREVLYYWAKNYSRKDIAGTLKITEGSVNNHITNIVNKLPFSNADEIQLDAGVYLREVFPNRESFSTNWDVTKTGLQNELHEETKGAGSVWIIDGTAQEVEQQPPPPPPPPPDKGEGEEQSNLTERIRLFIQTTLPRISDSDGQSRRLL